MEKIRVLEVPVGVRVTRHKSVSLPIIVQEKPIGLNLGVRTKTDTGRRVEHTQALGRTLVKELCKMAPYVRNKGRRRIS